MVATRITRSNLFTQARENVIDLIDDHSKVVDPVRGDAEDRKWVYARMPDVKAQGFQGYPFMVVRPATADFSENQTLDRKSAFVEPRVEVTVVSSDRGYNNEEGRGLEWLDQITDDVVETFNDVTNRDTLRTNGLYFSRPQVTDTVTEENEQTLVFRRTVMLPFRGKIQVSA